MVEISIGCKNNLVLSKEDGAYLVFKDTKTATSKAHKAFDITIPDEGKEGKDEVNETCPFCDNNINVKFMRESTKKKISKARKVCFIMLLGIPLFVSLIGLSESIGVAIFLFIFVGFFMLITVSIAYFISMMIINKVAENKIMIQSFNANNPDHFYELKYD